MSTRVGIVLTETGIDAAVLRGRRQGCAVVSRQQVAVPVPATLGAETDVDGVAGAIIGAVQRLDGLGVPAQLVIPSTWCFHQSVDAGAGRLGRTAAAFQLEEYLPVSLEEVTCAFAPTHDGRSMGLAVPTAPLQHLIRQLNQAGVHVEHIYADSFVATANGASSDVEVSGTLAVDRRHVGISLKSRGDRQPSIVRSLLLPDENGLAAAVDQTEEAADLHADHWTLYDLRPTVGVDAPLSLDNPQSEIRNPEIERLERQDAVDALQVLAVQHETDLPNLCTGSLAPASRWVHTMRLAARCVALLALLALVAVAWTADLYRQQTHYTTANHQVRTQQVELFQEALPDRTVPANPALRLTSERIRLEGLTRTGGAYGTQQPDEQDRYAAIDTLRHFVAGLPQDVRVLLLDWSIDGSRLSIRGQTADHRDAERITEVVNAIPGLSAGPPRTSRLSAGGVEFTIRVKRAEGP